MSTATTPLRLVLETLVRESDVQRVVALEAASYPADEAASERRIRYRQQHAGAFFAVAFADVARNPGGDDTTGTAAAVPRRELVGFVNGTLTASRELEGASMDQHDPLGTTLCIHSVVVDAAYRRQGLASVMLKQYVRDVVEQQHQVARIVLIAKAHLIDLYLRCGFAVSRLSPVVHGKDPWFELTLDCVAARRLTVVQVDAFTSEIFDGNPAAVVVMPPAQFHKPGVTQWMQRVAMENNLSETAFVARRTPAQSSSSSCAGDIVEFDLRWFTPAVEMAMCGHATLSSAFVLYEGGHVPTTATIHFHTLSGVLVCHSETTPSADKSLIRMEFPIGRLESADAAVTKEALARGLGIAPASVLAFHKTEQPDILVHVSAEAFASLTPDPQKLAEIEARGIVPTAEPLDKASGVDFQSRWFGPRSGVNEDPVTGSAHCALAVYWSQLLGKKRLFARQACPARGGFLTLELLERRPDIVLIKGEVVTVLRGELLTAP